MNPFAVDGPVRADLRALQSAIDSLPGKSGQRGRRAPVVTTCAVSDSRFMFATKRAHRGPSLAIVLPPPPGAHPAFDTLTRRERHVAALLASGLSNRLLAQALVVNVSTVEELIRSIILKTGLPSRAAVAAAWRTGIANGRI